MVKPIKCSELGSGIKNYKRYVGIPRAFGKAKEYKAVISPSPILVQTHDPSPDTEAE